MSSFFISCPDQTCVPAVSKPFEVSIEHFESSSFKNHFQDTEKLQSFVQNQIDSKFAQLASNSRERDHARAENPKISVASDNSNLLVVEMCVVFVSNNDANKSTQVPELWKVDMATKKVVEEEDEMKKVVFQKEAVTPSASTPSHQQQSQKQNSKEPTAESSSNAKQNKNQQKQQKQEKEDAATKKEIQKSSNQQQQDDGDEEMPTAAIGPSPVTKNEKGASCGSTCVIC